MFKWNVQVIDSTVERLPLTRIVTFLDILTEKIERRPSRGATLGVWVKSILITHAGFITTLPNIYAKLAILYEVIQTGRIV